MTMKRWNGSSWGDLTTVKRWNGSSWIDVTVAKRWNGSSWVDLGLPGGGGSLSVSLSRGSITGSVFIAEPAPPATVVTTTSVTATASGGTGPYTYSWTRSAGSGSVGVSSTTAATVAFSGTITKNSERFAVWRCTVTDSLGATSLDEINVTLRYETDI